MSEPVHRLTINGERLSPRQASHLPGSVTYQAIINRIAAWKDKADYEIVFTPMMTKSAAGTRGAKVSPFNNGNKRRASCQ